MAYLSKYEALAEYIRDKIRSGEWVPGSKIPSVTQLRAEFNIQYGTVRGAMLVLKAEGWVVGRHGDGVYVLGNPDNVDGAQ